MTVIRQTASSISGAITVPGAILFQRLARSASAAVLHVSTQLNLDTVRPFYWVSHSWNWMQSTLRPRVDKSTLTYYQRYGKILIFRCRRKPECPEKTYQGGYGIDKPNSPTTNHWLAALVKGKCSSTKPTRLPTGVVCHPDTEQNRPTKSNGPTGNLTRDLLHRKRELY